VHEWATTFSRGFFRYFDGVGSTESAADISSRLPTEKRQGRYRKRKQMKMTNAVGISARLLVALSLTWFAGCGSSGGQHAAGTAGSGGHGTAGSGTAGSGTAGVGTAGVGGGGGTGVDTAGAGGGGGMAGGTAGAGGMAGGTAGAGGMAGGTAGAGGMAGGTAGAGGAGGAGGAAGAAGADGGAGHDAGMAGADAAVDSPPDTGLSDVPTDTTSDVATCGADGMACETANGAAGTCLNHMCKACTDTTDDAKCVTAYGAGQICVAGKCVAGDCHTSAGCTTAGQVCGATVANKCGACASDTQCQTDTHYGATTICDTTTGHANSGKCVPSACTALGTCAANASDTCCNLKCVTGNCCSDDDCHTNSMFGAAYFCSANHVCSKCAAVTDNQYFVDPVGGDDATATGSGKTNAAGLPSCSFRTITRALQVIGNAPAAGTVITIVGVAGMTTPLYAHAAAAGAPAPETLPIPVPANVKITTQGGPISLLLNAAGSGFTLAGDGASLTPITAAPLAIDGNAHTSGVAISIAPGAGKAAALSNVSVKNTGDDGIAVTNGTVSVGPGVTVTSAGHATATGRASGLNVTGGVVTIAVPAGQTPSTFNGNTLHGIEVTLLGVLNVTGVPVTDPNITGAGTVVASGNSRSNIYIAQTPGMAPSVGTIDGAVGWNSTNNSGLEIVAGSQVKVRNSVLLNNAQNGVIITGADATAAGNALGGIDLGVAAGFGHNVLQATVASTDQNAGAGICIMLNMNAGAQTLNAAGNVFAGPLDCSKPTPGAGLNKSAMCMTHVDEAIVPATGTPVTITSSNCL
jgi:hypothetical protein